MDRAVEGSKKHSKEKVEIGRETVFLLDVTLFPLHLTLMETQMISSIRFLPLKQTIFLDLSHMNYKENHPNIF